MHLACLDLARDVPSSYVSSQTCQWCHNSPMDSLPDFLILPGCILHIQVTSKIDTLLHHSIIGVQSQRVILRNILNHAIAVKRIASDQHRNYLTHQSSQTSSSCTAGVLSLLLRQRSFSSEFVNLSMTCSTHPPERTHHGHADTGIPNAPLSHCVGCEMHAEIVAYDQPCSTCQRFYQYARYLDQFKQRVGRGEYLPELES